MRKFAAAVIALLAAAVLLVSGLVLTGAVTLVTTHGISMAPRIHAGDLVAVTPRSTYSIGDSVAYRSYELDTTVLHRLVAVQDGRYTFQGDNNAWLDPERPTEDMLIGAELLHIPGGGIWLDRLTSPVALGLGAFLLLATGGSAARTRRARRRRRTVSQHAARPTGRRSFAGLPSWATSAAATAAIAGVAGAVLGFAAWTASVEPATTTGTAAPGQQMTFSYTATVPASPAYDDTTVTAPQPVFRKLTDTVEATYDYTGAPGKVAVTAELSTSSGWTSTVLLRPAEPFAKGAHSGTVTLDLGALEQRARDAAEATGIPAGDVTVTIVPSVTTADGTFRPELPLTLSDLKLTLVGDKSALTVGDAGDGQPAATTAAATPALGLLGRELPVPTARWLSVFLLVGALLAAIAIAVTAWTTRPATEGAAIRVRHAHLLVEVQPIAAPPGRPVVDVVDFATLVKLAERYELLILHWIRGGTETFVVQDQESFYRYRSGAELRPVETDRRLEHSL